ncbi:hypothetical protein BDV98DRAFT_298312 [Pterulicium gracile]|uniref:Secreted protein n=1 Tax=Pterulicium gracile TaxID=1884261 RepID=A0A5C3Q9E8_9AGAR|nr:hypothetical protein BDV98DRAFT_298312 [Pterula gracilis]
MKWLRDCCTWVCRRATFLVVSAHFPSLALRKATPIRAAYVQSLSSGSGASGTLEAASFHQARIESRSCTTE